MPLATIRDPIGLQFRDLLTCVEAGDRSAAQNVGPTIDLLTSRAAQLDGILEGAGPLSLTEATFVEQTQMTVTLAGQVVDETTKILPGEPTKEKQILRILQGKLDWIQKSRTDE